MEICMITNCVKLMKEMGYTVQTAIWNMDSFPNDNIMILNYGYHNEPYPESAQSTVKYCPSGYPLGNCNGCGKCEQ